MKKSKNNERKDSPSDRGCYILLIALGEAREIKTGGLGAIGYGMGNYAYVGSALGGLDARLERHLRTEKKLHWHIDYLLREAAISGILICRTDKRLECEIARALGKRFESVSGFGSSDCRCRSHLFYSDEDMKRESVAAISETGIEPEFLEITS